MARQMEPSKRYLRAEELAEWIPFTLHTLRKKVSRGEIPHIKQGRTVIFDWLRITEWLAESAVEPRG